MNIPSFTWFAARRALLTSAALLGICAVRSEAQATASPPPNDAIFRRARRMVSEGNGMAGRTLADSVFRAAEEGTPAYGDALYWRGALAETAAEAERAYRRVIVEYPLSYYADDALLAIAELEQARGDRAAALQHLQRFVREHPASIGRAVAALAAARLAFEQHDTRVGCAMITEARSSAPPTDIELVNQIDYYGSRCTPAAMAPDPPPAAPGTPVTSVTLAPGMPRDSAAMPAPPKKSASEPVTAPVVAKKGPPEAVAPAPKAHELYTIQLAAYKKRPEADRLLASLASKGIYARVSGTPTIFRVRLNFYPTRQAAFDGLAALKQRGIVGFVTTEAPPTGPKTP